MSGLMERINHASDWVNPIVVKELRQAVRSRGIIGIIMFFLLLQVICTSVVLASTAVSMASAHGPAVFSAGRTLFTSLFVVLMVASMVMIPATTAMRFTSENQKDNVDLLFITTLTRAAIIRGKLAASAVLSLVIFSACLPFMAFCYLMRGIDLPSIFITLLFTYVIGICVNQAAILAGALSTSKLIMGLVRVAFSIVAMWGFGMVSSMGFEFVSSGVGSRLGSWAFWQGVLWVAGFLGSATLLLHVVSIAVITPPAMNRAFPVRLTVVALWLVWGVVAMLLSPLVMGSPLAVQTWAIISLVMIALMFFPAISERDTVSERTRRTIPRNRVGRMLAFLLYSGPAGGILLCELMALITVLSCLICGIGSTSGPGRMPHRHVFGIVGMFSGDYQLLDASVIMGSCCCYVLAYGLMALGLHRAIPRHVMPRVAVGPLAIILATVIPIIPALIAFTIHGVNMSWDAMGFWQLGNIMTVADPDYRYAHLMFSGAFAIAMLALNQKWIREQRNAFRHPLDDAPSAMVPPS